MLLQNQHLVVFLVFLFCLNPQLSFSSSFSPTTSNATHHTGFLCLPHQSHALLLFKSNFVIEPSASYSCDDSYQKTESWKEDTDCCYSWDGVTCDEVSGHVIELDLSCSQLRGIIHSNSSLFSSHLAPYLQNLNLAFNDFQGSNISSEFGVKFGSSLTHLNLSESGFSGNIPSEISHLSNIVSLDLSSYFSYRDLRVESDRVVERIALNLTQLRVLSLDGVDMSSIYASSLMNLSSSLTSLGLSDCQLQDQFPASFLLRPNLQELHLAKNNFEFINTSLPHLNSTTNNLTLLSLSYNDLSTSIGFLDFVGNHHKSLRHLNLYNCHISGPIPTSFSNLSHLTYLDMSYNELDGPLPSYLFTLPSLEYIDLSHNNLHGQIPTSPINSMNLTHLDLSDNNLSGSLDFDVFLAFKKLKYLDLSSNNISSVSSSSVDTNLTYSLPSFHFLDLSGCNLNQFPTFVKALTNLTSLDVSNNQIQGPIPEWIHDVGKDTLSSIDLSGNRFTSVGHQLHWRNIQFIDFHSNLLQGPLPIPPTTTRVFSVSDNTLSGEISSLVCNASLLETFDLSHNRFSGLMTKCVGSLRRLSTLNLGANNIHGVIPNTFVNDSSLFSLVLNGNQLRGTLPRSLAYCQSLQFLDVGNNMIEGTVPVEILKGIATIDLSRNKLEGHIPEVIGELVLLAGLNLSHNGLTGHIPSSIRDMHSLQGLDLSSNMLSGHIPRELGDLAFLTVLNLSHNHFDGHIPRELEDLTLLTVLDLSHNQLDGPIPHGQQFDTFGNDSYEDNLALCGFPLSKACGPLYVASENKDDSNSQKGFSWEGAFAGYGCGVVFGLCMGYVVFKKTRSLEWLVRMVEGKKQHGRDRKRSKKRAKTTLFMYR